MSPRHTPAPTKPQPHAGKRSLPQNRSPKATVRASPHRSQLSRTRRNGCPDTRKPWRSRGRRLRRSTRYLATSGRGPSQSASPAPQTPKPGRARRGAESPIYIGKLRSVGRFLAAAGRGVSWGLRLVGRCPGRWRRSLRSRPEAEAVIGWFRRAAAGGQMRQALGATTGEMARSAT